MMRTVQLTVACVAVLVAAAGQVQAGMILAGPSGFTGSASFSDQRVWGFDFEMGSSDALLTRLGAFDENGDGFIGVLNLGVWDRTTQNLVASTTMSGSGNPLESAWRWADVGPVTLLAGRTYSFGITALAEGDRLRLFNPVDISPFGTVGSTVRFATTTLGALAFPINLGNMSGDTSLRPGINADLSPANTVPEPASMALFGLGSLGIGVIARRRKQQTKLSA